ncbi:hypothetical protein FACS1894169_11950 [Bacteroidia bacterium]|nr:hypothetical protein FACS1894169_11950 [Bacteroidia bacterium]
MKNIYLLLALFAVLISSCSDDKLDSESIFDTNPPARNEFDTWLLNNYVKTYNVDFKYRYDDKESDMTYNLAPATYSQSVALAKLTKFLWFEAYDELLGVSFMRTNAPRLFQLIGSPAYNTQGSIVLGTAEGGLKVLLYNVNIINVDNPRIEELNYWFFKTMHHEFTHILNQKKAYTTDFNTISTDYQSDSWVNIGDWERSGNTQCLNMGFVSSYASRDPGEDFAEIVSIYVTHNEAYWSNLLNNADASGKAKIGKKFDIVKDYLLTSWNIEIDDLRTIVQRRSGEIGSLDLKNLN